MLLPKIRLRTDAATVTLVSLNNGLQERLRTTFKGDRRFEFHAIGGALSQFVAHFDPASAPSLLLADLNGDPSGAIASIENLRRHQFEGSIVAISDTLDEHAVRSLLRLRITDWLPSSTPTEKIVDACERALSAKGRPNRATPLECIAFVPAAGGVGNTTLAIQTGFLLARRDRNYDTTCLVDLDFQSGALADYLDLKPGFKIGSVADAPERLDNHLLQVMLARHETGMAVLAPPRSPTECLHIDGKVVIKALGVAAEMFDTMVVDLPIAWQPWTDDVLAGSDRIYVVTEFTVPALRKAHELATALRNSLDKTQSIKVIVNKFRRKLFSGGLSKRDATELLNEHLAGFVSEDYALVREAINRGRPLSAATKSNRLSRELGQIVNPA